MSRLIVVIPAGGTGTRFGGPLPKQFTPLRGIPVLHRTVGIFERCPRLSRIVVALSISSELPAIDLPCDPSRVTILHCAGSSRAQTVLNTLNQLADQTSEDSWILVHDAARPCLSTEALNRLLDNVLEDPVGGLLALPVNDTLKRQNEQQRVAHTVDRHELWAAQTPQMFRFGLLRRALTDHPDATDESSAVERLGYAPRLVLGEYTNIKITYPADLALAETFLERTHAHWPRL